MKISKHCISEPLPSELAVKYLTGTPLGMSSKINYSKADKGQSISILDTK
jgi:hypothetical protein